MRKSEFARASGVSRSLVGKLLAAGKLLGDGAGGIDDRTPINRAFLESHKAKAAGRAAPAADDDAETSGEQAALKLAAALAEASSHGGADLAALGLKPEEAAEAMRLAVYQARCKKLDAERKAVELDQLNGNLIERSMVEDLFTILNGALTAQFGLIGWESFSLAAARACGLSDVQRETLADFVQHDWEKRLTEVQRAGMGWARGLVEATDQKEEARG